ncbi:uncharacterized protein LOC118468552 isoform X2 [Anopheles albimanus]|uniref:Uncharacterized protein n=1 Tax=Anopheles albimanus TaxID=7167 RepID=A0A182F916_ANOAL|nr:uncharacterized protein LOC118468552 isoform X2 [Anopheles albimanus]
MESTETEGGSPTSTSAVQPSASPPSSSSSSLLTTTTTMMTTGHSGSGVSGGSPGSKKAAPQSHSSLSGTPVSLRPRGHYRSSSLENNPFHPVGGKPMIGLSIAQATSFTGTLKSRREQKRISDFLSKSQISAQTTTLAGLPSGASSLTLSAGSTGVPGAQSESSLRKAHFENIREIFEKNNSKTAAAQQQTRSKHHASGTGSVALLATPSISSGELTSSTNGVGGGGGSALGLPVDEKPPKIQSCSGILGKGKQVIRPIAFKPVPYKCNTPNYGTSAGGMGGRLTELSDRYGSTPSLGPTMSMQYKFGSTTDLPHLHQQQQHHHHHHHSLPHHHQQQQPQTAQGQHPHHHQQQQQSGLLIGSGGSNGSTPIVPVGPASLTSGGSGGGSMMSNSYHPHYHHHHHHQQHHQYGTLTRKGSTIPFKTYDSLESILKLPDSMVASYPNPSHGLFHQQDVLDMAPSPSDSGISELEAALRDRDSELAYLRQTMEHNEQDKEKHWEQELNRLKAIHESRLRAGAQKVHKLEQLLMMQTFQLRQDKKRLQEDNARLQTDSAMVKDQCEHARSELNQTKANAKELKEQNGDLLDEIQMLRRVISDLKERLEESEWNLCQKNGEIALMKTQLKEAQTEMAAKDQDIVQLKADLKLQNYDDISLKKCEIKQELDIDLEISQLNRIIIFKDQIIVLMNNEIQKLRKELSDISILRGYEGAPTGRYARYKKKLELVAQKFEEASAGNGTGNDSNNNNSASTNSNNPKPTEPTATGDRPAGNEDDERLIRHYFNSNLEMNKQLFLSSPICNYSDEDKSHIIDAYGVGKQVEMSDITLNLSSLLPSPGNGGSTVAPVAATEATGQTKSTTVASVAATTATIDTYHHQSSSSDDDYKSMTPTQDDEDPLGEPRIEPTTNGKVIVVTGATADPLPKEKPVRSIPETIEAVERLNRELQSCRASFEQERLKWADEKEKVLVYQRQLQKNYVEMCKRTQLLEQKLKNLQTGEAELPSRAAEARR